MSVEVTYYAARRGTPVREIVPDRSFTFLGRPGEVINVGVMGAGHSGAAITPGGFLSATLAADWMIGSKAFLTYSLRFLAGNVGGQLGVQLSANGIDYENFQTFPIHPGSLPTEMKGIPLVGWTARLIIYNNDTVARAVRGLLCVEGV